MMDGAMAIELISTDFDGTIFAEFENPPIPPRFLELIGELQARGARWVINTGRDMSSLMEALGRSQVGVEPDFLVLVEREIYAHENSQYIGLEQWNSACARAHAELFARIRPGIPALVEWINARFHARLYEDSFSPFCMIANSNGDADAIHAYLEAYAKTVPQLTVVRNDVYARFSHASYNKGTALGHLTKLLDLTPDNVFATGDWLNDLPMLNPRYARHLAAPANAIPIVKKAVETSGGFISTLSHGHGVAEGLAALLKKAEQVP
jgi:HAD superfamily hydrolase (TIGR01484 family)